MTIATAQTIWLGVGAYFAVGLIVALIYVFLAAPRLDVAARGSGFFFRLMVLPGIAGLWPIMVIRLLSGRVINKPVDAPREGT